MVGDSALLRIERHFSVLTQLLPMAQVNKANEPSWLPHNLSKISSWKLVSLTLSICRLINIWQYLRWFGNTTYTRKSILPLIHKLQYRDCGAQSCICQIAIAWKTKGPGSLRPRRLAWIVRPRRQGGQIRLPWVTGQGGLAWGLRSKSPGWGKGPKGSSCRM